MRVRASVRMCGTAEKLTLTEDAIKDGEYEALEHSSRSRPARSARRSLARAEWTRMSECGEVALVPNLMAPQCPPERGVKAGQCMRRLAW